MSAVLRFSLKLGVLLGGCAVALAVAITLLGPGRYDVGPLEDLCHEWDRGMALDEATHWGSTLRRIKAKHHITLEILEGRCDLLEAAARFRDLNQQLQHYPWKTFREIYAGANDDERHCHEVLSAVESLWEERELIEDGDVLANLQTHLRTCLERDGIVKLRPTRPVE